MCRALKVLCAAPGPDRLAELKRAAVSAHWELVGGAASLEELGDQLNEWAPDVLVLDAALGPGSAARCRAAMPSVRMIVISTGSEDEADATTDSIGGVRSAILGIPRPGGPVGASPVTQHPRTP